MAQATQIDFEIVSLSDGTFGVASRSAGRLPHVETGFKTRTEAEEWIFEQGEAHPETERLPKSI